MASSTPKQAANGSCRFLNLPPEILHMICDELRQELLEVFYEQRKKHFHLDQLARTCRQMRHMIQNSTFRALDVGSQNYSILESHTIVHKWLIVCLAKAPHLGPRIRTFRDSLVRPSHASDPSPSRTIWFTRLELFLVEKLFWQHLNQDMRQMTRTIRHNMKGTLLSMTPCQQKWFLVLFLCQTPNLENATLNAWTNAYGEGWDMDFLFKPNDTASLALPVSQAPQTKVSFPSLKYLSLHPVGPAPASKYFVLDNFLGLLAAAPNLKKLELRNCEGRLGRHITLPNLKHLRIYSTRLSAGLLRSLVAACPQLSTVIICVAPYTRVEKPIIMSPDEVLNCLASAAATLEGLQILTHPRFGPYPESRYPRVGIRQITSIRGLLSLKSVAVLSRDLSLIGTIKTPATRRPLVDLIKRCPQLECLMIREAEGVPGRHLADLFEAIAVHAQFARLRRLVLVSGSAPQAWWRLKMTISTLGRQVRLMESLGFTLMLRPSPQMMPDVIFNDTIRETWPLHLPDDKSSPHGAVNLYAHDSYDNLVVQFYRKQGLQLRYTFGPRAECQVLVDRGPMQTPNQSGQATA
ncbi:hypothetical protein B0H63DRAFT_77837 [Podospora didyma]|uniref:F-box domain-containing protein n=1 Tax=Podospora didyma TaxID=330526 RepID=A0AAE0K1Y6_9PEZI|nr:hypothetical protein B0H63DRAFT_77837 [Podospora didyma]